MIDFLKPLVRQMMSALPALFAAVGIVFAATPIGMNFFEGPPVASVTVVIILAFCTAVVLPGRLHLLLHLLAGFVVGTVSLMVLLADPGRLFAVPSDLSPTGLWLDVAAGWDNILTAAVPEEYSSKLLALPLAACWLATHSCVLLTMRRRPAFLASSPLLAAFLLFLLLGPGEFDLIVAAATSTCLLAHMAACAVRSGTGVDMADFEVDTSFPLWRFALRNFGFVGVPAVLIAVVGGLALTLASGAEPDRVDLHRPGGLSLAQEVTPLAQVRNQLIREPAELFTVRFSLEDGGQEAVIDRLRIATLDQYDGALFSADGVFLPVTRRARRPHFSQRETVPLAVEVRLTQAYETAYLPTVGLLRTVSGDHLGLNEGSDTLITERPGSPATILFTSALPVGPRPTVMSTNLPPPGAGPYDLAGFELPPEFGGFVAEVADGQADPLARLSLLEEAMQSADRFGYSVEQAYSGHSLPVLAAYLSTRSSRDFELNRQGYAEQAAAAFALLARADGFASRVAVGYLLDDPEQALAGEQIVVTTQNAHAWTEIYLGDEWVTFDPTNRDERAVEELSPPEVDDQVGEPESSNQPATVPPRSERPVDELFPLGRVLLAAGVVALVLAPPILKLIRRLLRRRGSTDSQIVGAWRELRDRLRDGGSAVNRSMGPRDLRSEFGSASNESGDRLEELSALLDAALFAPVEPDPAMAKKAWSHVRHLSRSAARQRSILRRLLSTVNPKSLRRPPIGAGFVLPERIDPADPPETDVIDLVDAEGSFEMNSELEVDSELEVLG